MVTVYLPRGVCKYNTWVSIAHGRGLDPGLMDFEESSREDVRCVCIDGEGWKCIRSYPGGRKIESGTGVE